MSHKTATLKTFCEITQKSSFNGQHIWRRRIISGNWNPLKNHEKYLFHLNKLNILLANQILHILCIFIKPNVWYSWSLKKLANKRWNFTGPPFCGGWTQKLFEILADISFESSFQNTVLSNLLLFLCACYQVDLDDIHRNEAATSTARNFSIVDSYTSFF